ncbi:MAG TPA: RNA polymerase sigma factor SigJ [Acidimicrobiales bacterium]|jgi:RNA polymerase sigma-70 factor (ECF subfamily)|nr:RNA polymerase sigma factor SigJ [Acidimicrobiales bacterium]
MDPAGELTRHRRHLLLVAYRMLGSLQAAEDVVQEAYLRADRAGLGHGDDAIVEPRAWLTRVVTRLALDELRSARARRVDYVGQWLPEPIVTPAAEDDPGERVAFDEQLSLALITVLETLSPAERAVYVLHEAFGVPLSEVADIVGRSAAATRQLATRARRHVRAHQPRFDSDPDEQTRLVAAFQAACETGDLDALARLLDDDVVFRTDGGGVVTAAREPIVGHARVLRAVAAAVRAAPDLLARPATINGQPGLVARYQGRAIVFAFVVDGGRITQIDVVANPAKLARLAVPGAADDSDDEG